MIQVDLTKFLDLKTPLSNPGKGWYHHQIDNGSWNYAVDSPEELNAVPGMDHVYLRLSWGLLEPNEGDCQWHLLDSQIEKFTQAGLGFSLRITCRETGERFATPEWVFDKGAKFTIHDNWGLETTCPDYGDPIFISELKNFIGKLSQRYASHPELRYVDVGTYGDWGECHNSFSTQKPASREAVLLHFQMHRESFPSNQLIVSDDVLDDTGSAPADQPAIREYLLTHRIGIRDDSILVGYYLDNFAHTATVRDPQIFADTYKSVPTVLELQHYHMMTSQEDDNTWQGKNGNQLGFEILKEAIRLMHPSYIGYHGKVTDWVTENPDVSGPLLNLCGYYLVPKLLQVNENSIKLTIENQGVAPTYFGLIATCKSETGPQSELKIPSIEDGKSRILTWHFDHSPTQIEFSFKTDDSREKEVKIALLPGPILVKN